jgi:hypothetical protein
VDLWHWIFLTLDSTLVGFRERRPRKSGRTKVLSREQKLGGALIRASPSFLAYPRPQINDDGVEA